MLQRHDNEIVRAADAPTGCRLFSGGTQPPFLSQARLGTAHTRDALIVEEMRRRTAMQMSRILSAPGSLMRGPNGRNPPISRLHFRRSMTIPECSSFIAREPHGADLPPLALLHVHPVRLRPSVPLPPLQRFRTITIDKKTVKLQIWVERN